MSYAVIRMTKIKGSSGSLGRHLDRADDGLLYMPDNAFENKLHQNIHWDKNGNSYTQKEWVIFNKKNPLAYRINQEIKTRYTHPKKIRKDAVKAIEYIMTSDTNKMNEIFSDREKYRSWLKDNKAFLTKVYGKENIVSMHLHMDERTPHLHAIVVPITKDGRLSCKSFVDGKKYLSQQQTLYSELMKKYGMKRGEFGSTSKHQKPNSELGLSKLNYGRN